MADSELWSLKIEKDRRWTMEFLFERADMLDQLGLGLLVAMAHVDPERIGARKHELSDRSSVARGGPERRKDLHLA
jgi:hypothetical protein